MSEEELHRGLSSLQASEFIYETNLFPEREFTFKHALTHEVTYGGLVQERKRGLHGAIVEAIERMEGDQPLSRWNVSPNTHTRGRCGTRRSFTCSGQAPKLGNNRHIRMQPGTWNMR